MSDKFEVNDRVKCLDDVDRIVLVDSIGTVIGDLATSPGNDLYTIEWDNPVKKSACPSWCEKDKEGVATYMHEYELELMDIEPDSPIADDTKCDIMHITRNFCKG